MTGGAPDAVAAAEAATPEHVTASLERLRRAGRELRARPPGEVLDALCRVLDGWSDPDSHGRRALLHALPDATGFSPQSVRAGLELALAHWTGDALRRLVERELGRDHAGTRGFETTAVLLAGSIPMPTLLAMLAPLVLRSPVLAKRASRDPVTPGIVARSLAESDAGLGACVEVVAFPGSDAAATAALLAADCVAATGSDETIAEVAARVRPPRRLVAAGHRLSLAALGDAATRGGALERAARGLALDTALWDQLGCLSPVAVYVASPDAAAADRVAEALAAALEDAEKRWPRGRVDDRTAGITTHECADAELRAAAGRRVALRRGAAWTVIREEDARPRPAPLHRFLRVHPVRDAHALQDAIAPVGPRLAAVAIAGFGDGEDEVGRALLRLGASRVCAPGSLQAPPLDWRREGRDVLTPLAAGRGG